MNATTESRTSATISGRISSAITSFLKWFPVAWTGASLAIVSVGMGSLLKEPGTSWQLILTMASLLFLVVAAGGLTTAWFWRTSDEVSIQGNSLLVRKGKTNLVIDKKDIKSIQFSRWLNPPLATVELSNTTPLGNKVTFFAPLGSSSMRPSMKIQQIQDWLTVN